MELKDLWIRLIKYYDPYPQPTNAQYKNWCAEMQRYNILEVQEMVEIIEKAYNMFPTIERCLAIVDSVAERNRCEQVAQENLEAKKFWDVEYQKIHQDNWGKQVIKLIKGLLNNKLTRGQYIQQAEELGIDVTSLKRLYESSNLDMSKVAGFQQKRR